MKKVFFLFFMLLNVNVASAAVIFEDNFDNRPDWHVPYASASQACSIETSCPGLPDGYYGYYVSPSVISPLSGHGLHLDSTNKRGDIGRGVTFWDQTNGLWTWTSNIQLAVEIPAQEEIYLRYYMKMQPNYLYSKDPTHSLIRKLNHISHYVYNGKPFTFFSNGGFFPTTINGVGRYYGNKSNIYNSFSVRPDTNYDANQPLLNLIKGNQGDKGVYNYFDLPSDSLPIGNDSGTGTEYNSLGMFGDGNWHSLEFYLKNNSAPGVADGEYKFWMDGFIQTEATGFIFRDANSVLPDNIWNFIHIGGNLYDPFLGAGISGEQWYAVDDLVISSTYVGPDYVIGTADALAPASPSGLQIN